MKIASIGLQIPSLRITNEDILTTVTNLNPTAPTAQVRRYRRQLGYLLERAGAGAHFIRDRANGEVALPLILNAAREALGRAEVQPSEIDLLIYCGVGRGFLEPATAYFISRALGIACECFDVLDACMSWVRALSIAQPFLASRSYSRILVVNGEFNVHEHGYPELFQGVQPEKLRYTFPAFTIGEAATATVLVPSESPWNFHFRSDPSRAHLCAIPLTGHEDFSQPGECLAQNGVGQFVSFGHELLRAALDETVEFIRETYPIRTCFDWWFPHAASAEMCRQAERTLSLHGKVCYDVFPRYGNLVSASIPAALHLAVEEGRLRRGQRIVLCPASAGMSFALVDLVY